ncbi:polymerase basic 2 protein [Quaranjavirus johnstonense]|uniref:Polymerase basic 2 protein n=1 Tax=Quaranjavirus johnstonense TaxID=688437 RepID=A0A6B9XJE9_9ORTO|nr:polymerase basic 2 protein [Quaranjavirus johnstonense]QHR77124.1 polymerase basic 2 protein [Quaranjavirus johnstonense]
MAADPGHLEARKRRLLNVVRKINETKSDPLADKIFNLLRTNPVCNKRVLTKYARVVKDPDPIATTQLLMGQKYPILAKRSYLSMFSKEEREANFAEEEDCRRPGWVRCTRAALNIWLEKEMEISEEVKRIIKVLYENSIELVRDYQRHSWDRAIVRYGIVPKERQVVATRKVLVDVPREYRQKSVVEIIQPGFNLNQPEVKIYVNKIIEKIGHKIITGMSIVDQARMLLNSLDPKMRMLPVAVTLHEDLAQHSISYYGNNWMVHHLPGRSYSTPGDTNDLRKSCQLIMREILKVKAERRKDHLLRLRKGQHGIVEVLQNTKENYPVKVIKSILGLPCSKAHDYFGTQMIIEVAVENSRMVTSGGGVSWREYLGQEKIYFKHEDVRGWYSHEGPMLKEIVFSRTEKSTFTKLLVNIANYIHYDWIARPASTLKEMRRMTMEEVMLSPWSFLGTTKGVWSAFWTRLDSSYFPRSDDMRNYLQMGDGEIRIRCVLETEIPNDTLVSYRVTEDGDLEEIGGVSRIPRIDSMQRLKERHLDGTWNSNDMVFIPILHPTVCLPRTIEFHFSRKELLNDILSFNFSNYNSHCPYLLPPNDRSSFCNTARMMLYGASTQVMKWPRIYLAYLYCFSGFHETPMLAKLRRTRFLIYDEIDLHAQRGVFRHNPENNTWLIFNKEWIGLQEEFSNPGALTNSALLGYRLENVQYSGKRKRGDGVMDLREGMRELESKLDGSYVYVRVAQSVQLLVRDRTSGEKRKIAMKRGLDRIGEDRTRDIIMEAPRKICKRH